MTLTVQKPGSHTHIHTLAVLLVFRFLTGFCSAAFFSVAGGSVSDLFHKNQVGAPMAMYTLSPFIGPVIGPVISGFIDQNTTWRWTYRVLIIWSFFQWVGLCLVCGVELALINLDKSNLQIITETFEPLLLAQEAKRYEQSSVSFLNSHLIFRLRKTTGDERYWAPLERSLQSPARNIVSAASKCFG
jgi:MFS family permease